MRFCKTFLVAAACLPALAIPAAADEPDAGQDLARQLRSSAPEENSQIHGTLIIRAGGQTREVRVFCRVVVRDATWETDYQIAATAASGPERLVVRHSIDATNEYLYARAPGPGDMLPKLAEISPAAAETTALAGSDFSLADLGLEFLHWPVQHRLKGEMRLGQPCYVLESLNPGSPDFARVKSYIDKDSNGLLIADEYDGQGRKVKEYSLHGSSFKKVNGHWRLEKMDIRSPKNHSRTELKFDMDKE
jgi:hypothetical protein